MANVLPYETTPADVILRIESNIRNPNVREVVSTVLKDGPRAYRIATLYEIVDPATQEHHHWCLRINSFDRTKKTGWSFKADKSVSLDDDGSQELATLAQLIQRAHAGLLAQPSGEYHLISAEQMKSVRTLLRFVRRAGSTQRMRLVRALLENLDVASVEPEEWLQVFDAGSESVRRVIAVSSRLAEYRGVRDQLAALIANPNIPESDLQRILQINPWLFGSEYSRLVSRRTWTRDDRLDFMLRRTADDYLEIIEIKTPLKQPLFRYDESHDSFAPSVPLSNALGQVVRYIEEVERNRDSIIAKDACDPLKIRARVIIGRDGDEDQPRALRNFNGHLHRVEVLTFDQLLRIANRVLSVFEDKLTKGTK
jgi:hypothetical protein